MSALGGINPNAQLNAQLNAQPNAQEKKSESIENLDDEVEQTFISRDTRARR